MTTSDWSGFERWHQLFDALCNHHQHYDNAILASALCRLAGKAGERDHEAAEKNLRNWRLGRRLPLRRNLAQLSHLLDVEADPQLAARWAMLYRKALGDRRIQVDANQPSPPPDRAWHAAPGRRVAVLALIGAGLAVAGIAQSRVGGDLRIEGADGPLPTVSYNARVVLAVGASKLVHGAFNDCDTPPPSWEMIRAGIPSSGIGIFEDAGPARQLKGICRAEVFVRAIRFTALRAGVEEMNLLGSYLRIEAVEPSATTDGT